MKKENLKQLVKECTKLVLKEYDSPHEPYDNETDNFAVSPRDRTNKTSSNSNPPEHNYDEKEEIKKINNILVICELASKKSTNVRYFPVLIKEIRKICLELLKMHGVK